METKPIHPLLTLPGAIIIAAAIIAIAIIWVKKPAPASTVAANPNQLSEINISPVTEKDHIRGNPDAKIKIIEYSDPSCPFCKMFHPTMKQVMAEYGTSGDVAWIYRHFPIDKPDANGYILHKNAGHEAEAMECAAALGGNDVFWAYTDRLYEVTPSVTPETPNGLDQNELPKIAKFVGLDPIAFNECLSSGRFNDKVEAQYVDGLNGGIQGTPYSIIISPSGTKIPISGAQPYNVIKTALDALLSEVK